MYLNYFISAQQIVSSLVVSIVYGTIWVVGSNLTVHVLLINFFFFQIEETCTFMNICGLKYHLSVIKVENSSNLCNFYEGRKGLRSMRSNADPYETS